MVSAPTRRGGRLFPGPVRRGAQNVPEKSLSLVLKAPEAIARTSATDAQDC